MYQPTAGGENVKLLQLLALDYSPRQRFAEANGGTPLHVAAVGNHVLTAHILIQAGADINALDDSNETPLMISCSQVWFTTLLNYPIFVTRKNVYYSLFHNSLPFSSVNIIMIKQYLKKIFVFLDYKLLYN